jgi:hypothetical protein
MRRNAMRHSNFTRSVRALVTSRKPNESIPAGSSALQYSYCFDSAPRPC